MIISGVPYYKQDTIYSCGAASLEMILRFWGIVLSEKRLIKDLKINEEDGMRHSPLISKCEELGVSCKITKNGSLEDVKKALNENVPVLVEYIEPSSNQGHYAVMVGMDQSNVILNDPWNGKEFKVKKTDFIERWHDEENKFPRWFAVITKKL